jgi:hypothetical protein
MDNLFRVKNIFRVMVVSVLICEQASIALSKALPKIIHRSIGSMPSYKRKVIMFMAETPAKKTKEYKQSES